MFETALVAFTTFFATVGPANLAALFAALTHDNTAAERKAMARKASLIGGGVLLFFTILGESVISTFGISLAALRTAGGILLLLIAIDMVFARPSGAATTTEEENVEAAERKDLSVFPLATPLIAGPGAIGAAILLGADAAGDPARLALVVGALLANIVLCYVLMLMATQVQKVLGVTGLQVLTRIVGILLAALAVQFIFDGIASSGLLPK